MSAWCLRNQLWELQYDRDHAAGGMPMVWLLAASARAGLLRKVLAEG